MQSLTQYAPQPATCQTLYANAWEAEHTYDSVTVRLLAWRSPKMQLLTLSTEVKVDGGEIIDDTTLLETDIPDAIETAAGRYHELLAAHPGRESS